MAGRYRQIDGCIDSSQWRVVRATIHTKAGQKKKSIRHLQATYTHNLVTSHISASAMGGRGGG